jgi:hypothetical protein
MRRVERRRPQMMEQAMEQPPILTCPACGDQFSTRQQLELHRYEAHQRDEKTAALQLQAVQPPDDEGREVF